MPSTYAGIIVDPNGESVVVDITTPGGDDITAYTAQDGGTAHTLPLTITTVTAFHIVQRQQVELSLKIDGDENADGDGGTLTVDLRGGGIFTVQAGVSGDGDPESLALERLIRRSASSSVYILLEPTGVADTAAITAAAVDAVAAGHNTVQLAAGTFVIDTDMPEWTSAVKLLGAGKDKTRLNLASGVTWGPRWAGTRTLAGAFTTVALAARAVPTTTDLTAVLAAGDWIFLSSGAFHSTRSYYNEGEWNRVRSITSGTLTLEFPTAFAYTTGDDLRIYKYTLLAGAEAKDFSVVASAAAAAGQHGLRMTYCDHPELDVHVEGARFESGVELYESRRPRGYARAKGVLDLADAAADAANSGWLGYGVLNVGCLDADLTVDGEDCRHAYDDSSLSRRPPATRSTIRGVATNCRAAGYSSHGGSRNLRVDVVSVDCGGGMIHRGAGLTGRVSVRSTSPGGSETNEYTALGGSSQSTQHALYVGEPNVDGVVSRAGQNLNVTLDADLTGSPNTTNVVFGDSTTVLDGARFHLERLAGSVASITNSAMTGTWHITGADLLMSLTADQSVTSSTTFVDATGLSVAVIPGTYEVLGDQSVLLYDGGTTGDIKVQFVGPASTTYPSLVWDAVATSVSGASATASVRRAVSASTSAGAVGAGSTLVLPVRGRIVVTTAGTLKIQFAQDAVDATATRLLLGSQIRLRRVA